MTSRLLLLLPAVSRTGTMHSTFRPTPASSIAVTDDTVSQLLPCCSGFCALCPEAVRVGGCSSQSLCLSLLCRPQMTPKAAYVVRPSCRRTSRPFRIPLSRRSTPTAITPTGLLGANRGGRRHLPTPTTIRPQLRELWASSSLSECSTRSPAARDSFVPED